MRKTRPNPTIYDVVALPASERDGHCSLWTGEDPSPCENPVEYVFVYEGTLDDTTDDPRNVRCCADCKPRVSMGTEADDE